MKTIVRALISLVAIGVLLVGAYVLNSGGGSPPPATQVQPAPVPGTVQPLPTQPRVPSSADKAESDAINDLQLR